ncbi:YiaA/YiaB family inner membrane protein [Primorskyibacter aestuariivivens]|uniref:YiaA/YiaB family inner membrane protein n=1 Tax=Primorskyibacter aestuariivivens TaxID=1888912 RepID=UPI0023011756|nr:YiaA/YiaB family inner membrane protein [Primorskyibacter aestuariivivens]MDA7428485.1 YiaA/YiaB family inner membrane protein [Primorskyibacter aestuariivivens]
MTEYTPKVSKAWNSFTYIMFSIAVGMMAAGIWNLEASLTAKGYYAMAALMLVYTTAAITKALRDREESDRIYNKLEDARTERMLAEVSSRDDA